MAQMILHGRELIRINTQKNYIEYSTNDGRSWHTRYTGTHAGNFIDLLDYGSEIIACTSKGIYFSMNKGIKDENKLCKLLVGDCKSYDILLETDPSLGKQVRINYAIFNSKDPLIEKRHEKEKDKGHRDRH